MCIWQLQSRIVCSNVAVSMPQPAFDWSVHFDHCILLAKHKFQRPIKRHDCYSNRGSDLGSDVQILVRTFGFSSLFLNVRTNVRTSEHRFGFGQVNIIQCEAVSMSYSSHGLGSCLFLTLLLSSCYKQKMCSIQALYLNKFDRETNKKEWLE
jgi:hypothetical protein